MIEGERYSFTEQADSQGLTYVMPYLPLTLNNGSFSEKVMALLDTGASVNVLPYSIGIKLAAVWDEQNVSIQLSGNLARNEARGLIVFGKVGQFKPVLLAFAWIQNNEAPVILGHMNFFAEFNVCFYRHELAFEVCPRER